MATRRSHSPSPPAHRPPDRRPNHSPHSLPDDPDSSASRGARCPSMGWIVCRSLLSASRSGPLYEPRGPLRRRRSGRPAGRSLRSAFDVPGRCAGCGVRCPSVGWIVCRLLLVL
ncbi:hypothetical protein GCM10022232_40860 [Streptomyces plumbiresistens]|uniref:Uncharacterized protein n=1 Tax=Streptomyces plumbiresistens TaxID=511811 RepID=A0ABP7RL95_9ACTN